MHHVSSSASRPALASGVASAQGADHQTPPIPTSRTTGRHRHRSGLTVNRKPADARPPGTPPPFSHLLVTPVRLRGVPAGPAPRERQQQICPPCGPARPDRPATRATGHIRNTPSTDWHCAQDPRRRQHQESEETLSMHVLPEELIRADHAERLRRAQRERVAVRVATTARHKRRAERARRSTRRPWIRWLPAVKGGQ